MTPVAEAGQMDCQLRSIILSALERAPDWIKRDLNSKDVRMRIRAEESLAAIIESALIAEYHK